MTSERTKPEEKARENIDEMLVSAGWIIQNREDVDLNAGLGVAVREVPLSHGITDYLLCVAGKAVGTIEAKQEGTVLVNVEDQSKKYLTGIPNDIPHVPEPLPFCYESTGTETTFRDLRDPESRSRYVFNFHTPEHLGQLLNDDETLRKRLTELPPLDIEKLWDCQKEAIKNLEISFSASKPRALIQMATGSGKTFTAVNFVYRLIKFAKAKRVLFLVDRTNLGKQAEDEFKNFVVPHDGRKFTELYNVQRLSSNNIDKVSRVCITTIQRLYSMLKGQELDPEEEEQSLFERPIIDETPEEVMYNPSIPIETFDFIVVDECHRSIYTKWRPVLEYFDAFTIGLTATPSKQTFGFFNQNLVMEYAHERAVADGINVTYDPYRIKTQITEKGSKIEAGSFVYKREKLTRKKRWEELDAEVEYESKELDRSVVSEDQIRTVIRTFKDKLFTELFPGRKEVPKTLVFAKDDSHADDIVRIIREEFGKGNDFCKKITYRSSEKSEDLISQMRNDYNPRIAVTVDLVSTGIDIKPLECLLFMRDVKSRVLFEQMIGRGTRTISSTKLREVTPDATFKNRFMIIDAVGVFDHSKIDTRPLERNPSISIKALLEKMSWGNLTNDHLSSLASRLSRLDKRLSVEDRKELEELSKAPIKALANRLLDAIDPDKHEVKAKELFKTERPTKEQVTRAREELVKAAWAPFKPTLRKRLVELKKQDEQIIDEVSKDVVIAAEYQPAAKQKAQAVIKNFRRFIDENKDELTAFQIIYSKPYTKRKHTYEQIEKLASSLKKPPYSLTPELVWRAYETLEKSKVRGAGPVKNLTNIITLIRFSLGQIDFLETFEETVNKRFKEWMEKQKTTGITFNQEQLQWLKLIKDDIATSYSIEVNDFEFGDLYNRGGILQFQRVFGPKSEKVLQELNEVLVA